MAHGELRAALDAGRTVADHPVEALAEFADHALDALFRQRVLVARLRSRQQRQHVDALVLDECLVELGVALHHVDEVVDDAPLGAHHEVEVPEADVEVDHADALAGKGQGGADRGGGRRLADSALA